MRLPEAETIQWKGTAERLEERTQGGPLPPPQTLLLYSLVLVMHSEKSPPSPFAFPLYTRCPGTLQSPSHSQNTTHRVQNHLQHRLGSQTSPNHIRYRLCSHDVRRLCFSTRLSLRAGVHHHHGHLLLSHGERAKGGEWLISEILGSGL